ncbi:hypothetical protein [Prosthecobacter sp.]|uniref:hypothetical protein n=1 Tax=Prosthecobacter sp. TaxID=1965333 RepID=UPI0039049F83
MDRSPQSAPDIKSLRTGAKRGDVWSQSHLGYRYYGGVDEDKLTKEELAEAQRLSREFHLAARH